MKYLELQKTLKSIKKPFYTTSDLEKIIGLKKASLTVTLNRLVKKNLLLKLSKGVFILPENLDKIPEVANQIYTPSYLSFESALSRYGILSQFPYTFTFATNKRSKKLFLGETEIEYRQLKPDLFSNFIREGDLLIAQPEKALLDQLYLISRGKTSISLDELDLSSLNKKKFIKMSKIFPKETQRLTKGLLKY